MGKICFKCGLLKPLNDFYQHDKMKDGHLNKCKDCTKNDVHIRDTLLREDFKYCEKERLRSKEKYHRLNYKEKQFLQHKSKPYINSVTKNIHRKLKLQQNQNAHHWNYNFLDDVIVVDRKIHKKLHTMILLHSDLYFTNKKTGNIMNKKDHIDMINEIILKKVNL